MILLISKAAASLYDPHPLTGGFEGWYIRVVDHESTSSFAMIFASFYSAVPSRSRGYAAVLDASDGIGLYQTASITANISTPFGPVRRDPDLVSAPNFEWTSSVGRLEARPDVVSARLQVDSISVDLVATHHVPWDPCGEGPGGPVEVRVWLLLYQPCINSDFRSS